MPEMMRGAGISMTPDIAPRAIPEYDLAKLATSAIQSSTGGAPASANFEGTLSRLVGEIANKDAVAKDAVTGLTSGVPEKIEMESSGRKTRSMLDHCKHRR